MKQLYQYLFGGILMLATAGLLQAQDLPVDLVTGAPVVSIPIYTAVNGDISIPISISYSSNGVKVSKYEQGGDAGLGWSLNTGGGITRVVRGLPDDYAGSSTDARRGWLHSTLPADIKNFAPYNDGDPSTCTDESPTFDKLQAWFIGLADTEPDEFYFQCGAYSGKFFWDNNKEIQVVPYQNISVAFDPSSKNFTITTGEGTTYIFSAQHISTQRAALKTSTSVANYFRTTYEYYKNIIGFTSAWSLTEVISLSGKKIYYHYENDSNYEGSESIPVRYADYSTSTPTIQSDYSLIYSTRQKPKLVSITDGLNRINFGWNPLRHLGLGGVEFIRKIKVVNGYSSEILKEFIFDYNTVSSDGNSAYLQSLTEKAGSCALPPYTFNYFGVDYTTRKSLLPLGSATSVNKDYWGYYNENTSSEIPTLWEYYDHNGFRDIRIEPLEDGHPYTVGLSGNNRSTNITTVAAGMLDKVTYPSGGHLSYIYEPSDFYDVPASKNSIGGGVRVKKVILHDGQSLSSDIVKEITYKDAQGKSSGKLPYPPVFAIPTTNYSYVASLDNLAPESTILYERVSVSSPGAGITVYEYDLPSVFPAISSAFNTVSLYARKAGTAACADLGNIINGNYNYPYPPNTESSYLRGQIKRILYFDEADKTSTNPIPLREEIFEYNKDLAHSTKVLIKGLHYEKINDVFVYGHYDIIARNSKVLTKHIIRQASQDDRSQILVSETKYTYNGAGEKKLLSLTETKDSEGRVRTSSIKYSGDFTTAIDPNSTKLMDVAMRTLQTRKISGVPIETISRVQVYSNGILQYNNVTGAAIALYQPRQFAVIDGKQYVDSYIQPLETYKLGRYKSLSESNVNQSSFWFDQGKYILSSKLNYDNYYYDHLVNIENDVNNQSSYHYGYKFDNHRNYLIAEINNAKPEEILYDNFEYGGVSAYGFDNPSTNSLDNIVGTVAGWTGEKAFAMSSSTVLSKAEYVNKNIGIPTNYRLLCRVKSANAGSLTVSLVGNTTVNASKTYTASPDKWQLLEVELNNVSLTSTTFKVQFSTNQSISIDDIVFAPAKATVITSTYKPGIGKTSVTNSRGFTEFYRYDPYGRLTHIIDQDGSFKERKSYKYSNSAEINPFFTTFKIWPNVNETLTFSAQYACRSSIGYKWFIDGVQVADATSSVLTYTFPTEKEYEVELQMTEGDKSASYKKIVQVLPPKPTLEITVTGEQYQCASSDPVTFSAKVNNCSGEILYKWEMRNRTDDPYDEMDGTWSEWSEVDYSSSYTVQRSWSGDEYVQVRCIVTACYEALKSTTYYVTYKQMCN
jgi:YD repeat-containing protein